jgi:hypothetical protein
MSLVLDIIQKPLDVTESHSDHTWNIKMNDYSAYTDIRLVVDIYKNPYGNEIGPNNTTGTEQDTRKACRLLVPVNEYGHCIFNVETVIRNFVTANPRNSTLIYDPTGPSGITNPYNVYIAQDTPPNITGNTSQATINNGKLSTVSFANGFNGGYEGFENLFQVNEYRCIFGVQYTSGTTTTLDIDTTNYGVYSGWTGQSINPLSASTQPYGIMIYPGVQDNKRYGVSSLSAFTYYYSGTNLTGKYNYLNTRVFDYAMNTGTAPYNRNGNFMGTFGDETIPMTIFGTQVGKTRWRTHYYNCPIVLPFMYGENPLFDNSSVVNTITYLLKTQGNGQMNYDVAQSVPISFTTGAPYNSYLGQRISYAVYKQNPNYLEQSDVAIFLSSGTCDPSGSDRVSEIVQYKMVGKECFNDPYNFLFMNRQGCWDTYTFTKKNQKTYAPKMKTYQSTKSLNTTLWNRQSYNSIESVYNGTAEELFTFDSGFVYQNDRDIIEQMLMSPYLYMIMDNYYPEYSSSYCSTGDQTEIFPYLIPCIVMNKSVEVFQQKYQRIFQYTLEVKQTPYRRYDLPY